MKKLLVFLIVLSGCYVPNYTETQTVYKIRRGANECKYWTSPSGQSFYDSCGKSTIGDTITWKKK